VATDAFHATWRFGGRHAIRELSVHAALPPTHPARIVIGGFVALGALTVELTLSLGPAAQSTWSRS
jgi:hypothetical protein